MIKHFSAFRDRYLAAILSAVVILLSVIAQAQKKYQQYPTPGQAKWWMADSTQHVPAGPTPSLNSGATRPGALYYVITAAGDTALFSWTGSRWKREGGGGSLPGDSTHSLVFSTPVFDHWLVLAGQDPVTGEWLYNDSISLKGPLPSNNQFFGMRGGVVGFYDNNLQTILDVGATITKNNRIYGPGWAMYYDSLSMMVNAQSTRDTVFRFSSGGNVPILVGRGTTGTVYFNRISNNTANFIVDPNGIDVLSRLRLRSTAKISGYQSPITLEREFPGSGGWDEKALVITQDLQKGTSNSHLTDSSRFINISSEFRDTTTGVSRPTFKVFADGTVWMEKTEHATNQDSFLVKYQGKIMYRTLAEIIAAVGGGGGISSFNNVGSTPNAAGASVSGSTATLQPADATNPGVVTAGTQTIGGAKTFSSNSTQFTPATNNESVIRINTSAGTPVFQVGPYTSNSAFVGFWGGNITPGSANFFMQANDQSTRFRAAGSDRITINSTGTGINTTAPETVLDVNGEVQLRSVADATTPDSSLVIENGKVKKAPAFANSGSANRIAYYPSSGTTVADLAAITANRALASDANGLPIASTLPKDSLDNSASKQRVMQVADSVGKFRPIPASVTSATSVTLDYNTREEFAWTLGHNTAVTVSNMKSGGTIVLYVTQDGTGDRTIDVPGPNDPSINTTAGSKTMLIGWYSGSDWIWSTDIPNTSSGRYTPTVTAGINISSVGTIYSAHYTRVGNEITVYGDVLVDATAATTNSIITISFPNGWTATNSYGEITGSGSVKNLSNRGSIAITNGSSTSASVVFTSVATGQNDIHYHFTFTKTN